MIKTLLLLASGVLGMALLAEVVLRLCPVSTGYHLSAVDEAQPIVHGAPRAAYTYSKDWNFHLANSGMLNNAGFRSSIDYVADPRSIAVVGNSFIQADALPPTETLTERAGRLLGRPAYAVGGDGFSLADYLAAARWATLTYHSQLVIILLTTGDLAHSCTPRMGGHNLQGGGELSLARVDRPDQTPLRTALNASRLFRYGYDNLRAAANWSRGWQRIDDRGDAVADPAGASLLLGCANASYEDRATRFLLRSFHEIENDRGARIVFLVAPGYRREQMLAAGETRDVDRFARSAGADGFQIITLDAEFAQALHDGARLDFLPVDGHWNGTAHALAAAAVANALSGSPRAP